MISQHTPDARHQHDHSLAGPSRHRGHGWMMIACCIPMMALMMAGMRHDDTGRGESAGGRAGR